MNTNKFYQNQERDHFEHNIALHMKIKLNLQAYT